MSNLYRRLSPPTQTEAKAEQKQKLSITKTTDPPWKGQTSFRSILQLSGSPVVYIWFESIQETGVRFSLDMTTGILSDLENWTPDIEMPGGDSIDPEPLSVWGIDSADDRVNIIMQVDRFDDLFVDGSAANIADNSEVTAIVAELTNVVVRDLWIEAHCTDL